MPDSFNLRALIREVCDSSTIADPRTLSLEVFKHIDPDDYPLGLQQALPNLVGAVVSQSRMQNDAPNMAGPRRPKSRKVAGYQQLAVMLRDRLNVGPDVTDWKFLGDCTATDLTYAKQVRESIARANQTKALQYGYLASQLAEHGVDTVKDLPENLLTEALQDAA